VEIIENVHHEVASILAIYPSKERETGKKKREGEDSGLENKREEKTSEEDAITESAGNGHIERETYRERNERLRMGKYFLFFGEKE